MADDNAMRVYVNGVLEKLKNKNPQYDLEGSSNMWIVKPGTKSRGRGIEVLRNYDEIIKYTLDNKGAKWVVQKYIENPMIIDRKKFDIR
jgi:tubulin monoglycylase TTLL3/8